MSRALPGGVSSPFSRRARQALPSPRRFAFAFFARGATSLTAGRVVVENEFVAIGDQEIRRRVLDKRR
jgi:hypothetical protein